MYPDRLVYTGIVPCADGVWRGKSYIAKAASPLPAGYNDSFADENI
jgi:hypothetical protein